MRRTRAALALSIALGLAAVARAEAPLQPWATDPVYVFYPKGDCRGGRIELEVWDRQASRWKTHPGHPRVPVESCQLEDAGTLFNELRWRCVEPPEVDPPAPWVVGVEVFDPEVMQSCAVEQQQHAAGLEVHVISPAPGETVSEPEMEIAVRGSVRMDGLAGTEYDVLLVIDRSEATTAGAGGADDLLAAQVSAARALLVEVAPRLGPVRVGVVTYPNQPPLPGSASGTGALRALAFSDDAEAISQTLDAVQARGASGLQTFRSAFSFALDELTGRREGSGMRPKARKVLVLLASARAGSPFGAGAARDARLRSQLAERIVRAAEARVRLHLYVIGGLAEALAPGVPELFERAHAEFRHVSPADVGSPFLSDLPLPRVERVLVASRTMGGDPRSARVAPDGSFRASIPTAPGDNRVWARATLSDGVSAEREWRFTFDMSQVRERLLAKEREHMRRVREQGEKRLEVRPARPDERLAPATPVPDARPAPEAPAERP